MAVPEKPISVTDICQAVGTLYVWYSKKIAYSTFKSSIFMLLPCNTPKKEEEESLFITTAQPELVEFVSVTLTPTQQRNTP